VASNSPASVTTTGRIWVLDGDLGDSNGAARFAERHPERFVVACIAEQQWYQWLLE
jgi:transketolase C-terminal domain/subunit